MYNMIVDALIFQLAMNKMTDKDVEYGLSVFRLEKDWMLIEQPCNILKVHLAFYSCMSHH